MRKLSVRGKLILVLSTILILAFVSTSLISYLVSKRTFQSGFLDETLPLISNNILSEIQNDLMTPVQVSSLMANDTFLKDWALNGERDVSLIEKYLAEIKNKYGFFTAFFISDQTGRYYYYDGILKTISPGDEHDDWYYAFKAMDVPVDLDVDTDEASAGTLTIFINHRLNDYEGDFLGVTGVGLKLEHVGEILKNYEDKYDRTVYFVDPTGLIQAHPEKGRIANVRMDQIERYKPYFEKILSDRSGLATYEFERGRRKTLVAVRYFPDFNWFLVVEQDQSYGLGGIRGVLFTNLSVGLLATAVIIGIVVLVVNYFQTRLEYMATTDELTRSYNRRQFMELLGGELGRTHRYGRQLSLLLIDVDHFKSVNDRFGHSAGDRVLADLARTIQGALRSSDVLGRLGGEEFGVILPETGPDEAGLVAERIRTAVESRETATRAGAVRATVSIGVAAAVEGGMDAEELLHQSDMAMYRAKAEGRNRVEIHET
jgi:diguanylate cyclase (GGDEF)-like protein